MVRKRGLGRGLDALIPVSAPTDEALKEVAVSAIRHNPRQVRTTVDQQELEELAASIREHGILQPIVLARTSSERTYTLIAGQRRLEAASIAGLLMVPAVIRDDPGEQGLLELALIENIQRSNLNPLEAATAYQLLAEDFQLSHDDIARRVGKQRSTVTNTIRLLRLPKLVQDALSESAISSGHARALLRLTTPQAQSSALTTILSKDLTVRQTEDLVRKLTQETRAQPPDPARDSAEADLEDRLREQLGTKVLLNRGRGGRGTITIHFYSDEELNALADLLLIS